MRKDIHPDYQEVLFHDTNADVFFLTRSTAKTKATREYEGKEYPYYPLDISSASHPFYTGEQRKTSTEGRVASFNKRFGAFGGRNKKAADSTEQAADSTEQAADSTEQAADSAE